MSYATETPQVSAKFVNSSFVQAIDNGRTKEAADTGTNFIREIVRQASSVREIIPPVGLSDDDIHISEETDEPKKIIEKEPSSQATFVELQGTPQAFWFKGPRYAVYFGKIMSGKATKSKAQLMTYQNDIRKILSDNFVKDMADQEDKNWRNMCLRMVNSNAGMQRTSVPAFTSAAFKRAFQALLNRRRPIGKLLLTESLFMEALDLPATAVGNDVASSHYRKGIQDEKSLFGYDVVLSMKSDIYDPRECWVYSPQNFLGNFFLLQDATLFIKQEAEMIEFYTYELLGMGIGNRLSMQHLVFPPSE